MSKPLSFLPILSLAVLACQDIPTSPIPGYQFAEAHLSCPPGEGPVTVIWLTTERVHAQMPRPPLVTVQVKREIEDFRAGMSWAVSESSRDVSVLLSETGPESAARSGEVGITDVTDDFILGYVDVSFGDGRKVRGSFEATYSASLASCG